MMTALVGVCGWSFGARQVASVPLCQSKDLDVDMIAVDHWGMSQTVTVYAVTNTKKWPCYLPTYPLVWVHWGQDHEQKLQSVPALYRHPFHRITLSGYQKHRRWFAKNLVWFAIKANSATYPSDKNYLYPFNRISMAMNSGTSAVLGLPYQGYTSYAENTAFHRGLNEWGFNKKCLPNKKRLSSKTPINLKEVLNCG